MSVHPDAAPASTHGPVGDRSSGKHPNVPQKECHDTGGSDPDVPEQALRAERTSPEDPGDVTTSHQCPPTDSRTAANEIQIRISCRQIRHMYIQIGGRHSRFPDSSGNKSASIESPISEDANADPAMPTWNLHHRPMNRETTPDSLAPYTVHIAWTCHLYSRAEPRRYSNVTENWPNNIYQWASIPLLFRNFCSHRSEL